MKMKHRFEPLTTQFAPDVRFEVEPLPFRATETTALEQLKERLLRELLAQTTDLAENTALRRAANDAVAIAWLTRFPLLVFPALLQEKAQAALTQGRRQTRIRQRSQNFVLTTA